ncbi:hypothetical protein B0T18DRAFT_313099 [Schizothecium vesticola]|uniref:Uncharacterized protein n=1 Tax=Schizothecium vesticola TaxID=314040 RepID=A0AA40F841_9PEZI|nr:hypothetical protein B0T18DRAFT_313099 [Schizothecium vesticola]
MPTDPSPVNGFGFNLIHQRNKLSSRISTAAWTWDWSRMLAQSCSGLLSSGVLEHLPIHFDVDKNGNGSVLVGSTPYPLQGLNKSDHFQCSGMYGEDESVTKCSVQLPLRPTLLTSELTPADCGSEGPLGLASLVYGLSASHFTGGGPTSKRDQVAPMNSAPAILASKQRRQGACGTWSSNTVKFEDGHPHQQPVHKQLSENLDCGDGTCSAEYLHVESFTIGFTATGSAQGWIDAGFAVEKSVETGTSQSCDAKEGKRVCVWKKVHRTAYAVQNMRLNQCTGAEPVGGSFTMVSPNKNQPGTNFYCVGDEFCREIGAQYEEEAVLGAP